jgi:hypothetical protein
MCSMSALVGSVSSQLIVTYGILRRGTETLRSNEANFDALYKIYCNLGQFTLIIREADYIKKRDFA